MCYIDTEIVEKKQVVILIVRRTWSGSGWAGMYYGLMLVRQHDFSRGGNDEQSRSTVC